MNKKPIEGIWDIVKTARGYLAFLAGAMIVLGLVISNGMRPVSADRTPVRVVVPRGATAGSIAHILANSELVRSSFMFRLACRVTGAGSKLKPGVYEMSKSMSMRDILDKMVGGKTCELWLTFPEGYTVKQMGDLIARKRITSGEAFVYTAISEGYKFPRFSFIPGHNLEGYLFPDTYLLGRDADSEKIISVMLETFDKKVARRYREDIVRVSRDKFGMGEDDFALGLHKIITLASLIEREARVPADRAIISAVLWNRLRKNMRLEVDATVSYVPGKSTNNKDRVLYSDLDSNSPYNTYRRFGLPPAPICNPGAASIYAALNPANVDYLFYVARPDGSHIFSRTYEEHLNARKRIREGT